jgi:hypothetical protein
MRALCTGKAACSDSPHFSRRGSHLEYPLLITRRRKEDGAHGYAGMASEKPMELSGVSDEDWDKFQRKVNDILFTCPFSYGRILCYISVLFIFVATSVIATFGTIGNDVYFWDGFWRCQDKGYYQAPYTYEFCVQYSGWGTACILSFFTLFCFGLFTSAYIEARIIKRWRREIEPQLVSICQEYTPIFERNGVSLEMQRWTIIFRIIQPDSEIYEPPDIIEIPSVGPPVEEV